MPDNEIDRAFALNKIGNKTGAREILARIVHDKPKFDRAWLWLADAHPDNTDRIAVLEEGLKINPDSWVLRKWLGIFRTVEEEELASQTDLPVHPLDAIPGNIEEELTTLAPPVPGLNPDQISDLIPEQLPDLVPEPEQAPGQMPGQIPAFKKGIRMDQPLGLLVSGLGLLIFIVITILGIWISQRNELPSSQGLTKSLSAPAEGLSSTPFPSPTAAPIPTESPTPTLSPTPAQSPAIPNTPMLIIATINRSIIYPREGPSANHEIVPCNYMNCLYPRGTQVILVEKHEYYGEAWYLGTMPDGKTGWFYYGWLQFNGDQDKVPTAIAYPTYPSPATATTSVTPTP
jgi:hypothetical protein